MNKDVLLSIRGLHFAGPDDNAVPIEVISPAEYYFRNGKHYILYDELPDDHSGLLKTKIKISNDIVELTKSGPSTTHMQFEKGKKTMTCYNTSFGSLMLAITTNTIQLKERDTELSLKVDYLLEANYEPVADCHLEIHVSDKNPEHFSLES